MDQKSAHMSLRCPSNDIFVRRLDCGSGHRGPRSTSGTYSGISRRRNAVASRSRARSTSPRSGRPRRRPGCTGARPSPAFPYACRRRRSPATPRRRRAQTDSGDRWRRPQIELASSGKTGETPTSARDEFENCLPAPTTPAIDVVCQSINRTYKLFNVISMVTPTSGVTYLRRHRLYAFSVSI